MSQAVLKWGNSLAFRIPSAIAKQMQIEEGAEVELPDRRKAAHRREGG